MDVRDRIPETKPKLHHYIKRQNIKTHIKASGILQEMKFVYLTLMVYFDFMGSSPAHFKLIGPEAPLKVDAGYSLVLPCALQPNVSAVDMMLEWLRDDIIGINRRVHLYEGSKDVNDKQIPSYRGRTSLFKEELQKGNASLKLSAVQPSDEGDYKCVIRSESSYEDITFHVTVKVENLKVFGPTDPLVAVAGEDLVLPCFIQPSVGAADMRVEWFRMYMAETLVHLYEDNQDKNDQQMDVYRGRTALFKEELENGNASLKLSSVRTSDEGVYKCLIESYSWYDDINIYVEVKGKGFHAWKIAVICIAVFGILFAGFAAFVLGDMFLVKTLSPAQCSVVAYLHLNTETPRNEWKLKKYNTTDEGLTRLIKAIPNCRKVRLDGCNLTETSMETLVAALQKETSSLIHLDLNNNKMSDSGVEKLFDGLNHEHCGVERLGLSLCKLSSAQCRTLGFALQTASCPLRELDLSKNDLRASVKLLCDGLMSSNCKLNILRLAVCNLDEGSCSFLSNVLQSTNPLMELNLSNNKLHDSGVELLSIGLKSSHCKLEILRLAGCNLESCRSFASILTSGHSTLRDVDLSNNNLQDLGVKPLTDELKNSNCKLAILRLSGCMLTEVACTYLASALSSNSTHLEELDLTYNYPGEIGVKLLYERLKDPHFKLDRLMMENAGKTRINFDYRKYACELTLDPNTAQNCLCLSEENKKAVFVREKQPNPDHPERFDFWKQVLCRENLNGRCYWEAEWSGGAAVAVTYSGTKRKGGDRELVFGYNKRSWRLDCSKGTYSVCHDKDSTIISETSSQSNKVGVYLDWPAGILSFYSVSSETHNLTHLHTFHSAFTEPLLAGFGFWDYNSSVCLCQTE